MTLGKLLLYIGTIALVLTLVIGFMKKGHKSWVMTFLQNFTGVLFVFSGWVKAIDPMGTAFKMEQYFVEFETTLEGTWFAFLAPLFPWLSEHSIWFSVFMIILEIVVGAMLILGHRAKVTSWIFLLVIAFFTVLTGFTFLTGYVPSGENFFAFSKWVSYDPANMRVTDCGCFGDFIKLEPRISFYKDVVLLIPALFFVFRHKDMHQLFSARVRNAIAILLPIGLLLYCLSNFKWNEPHTDFRPFKVGVDIAERKAAEEDAQAAVEILTWKLKSKTDGRIVELSNDTYMKDFRSYPREEWEVVGQTKSTPAIAATKISDFEVMDLEGNSVTSDILGDPESLLLIVCYKLKGKEFSEQRIVRDSVFVIDTIVAGDSVRVVKSFDRVDERTATDPKYTWDDKYLEIFGQHVQPLVAAAAGQGIRTYGVAGAAAAPKINAFTEAIQAGYPMYEADDVMLKTIMRSNPGVLLLKEGTILGKWHWRHLPDEGTLKQLIERF